MEKIEKCPKCNKVSPALTLQPTRVFCIAQEQEHIPDTREYKLICLKCNEVIETISIDNTIAALHKLNEELDSLYGPSHLYQAWPFWGILPAPVKSKFRHSNENE